MKAQDLLIELSNSYGPVGYEDDAHEVVKRWLKPYVEEFTTDALNNLIARSPHRGKTRAAIFTHLDEIGLVITSVDERGFARFTTLGGIDPKILISQRIKIRSKDGTVRWGVVGMLAPHLQKPTTRGDVPDYDALFMDVSANNDFQKIEPGDLGLVDSSAFEMQGKVTGKTLDDRACCAVSILAAREMQRYSVLPETHFVFTSQEEDGASGARGAAEAIRPDVAIVMDGTLVSKDYDIELGKGPVITLGGVITSKKYVKLLEDTAKELNIECQFSAAPGSTGTDADSVQMSNIGVPTVLLEVPMMYMHTPVEVVQISDVEAAARLLAAFLNRVEEGAKNEA